MDAPKKTPKPAEPRASEGRAAPREACAESPGVFMPEEQPPAQTAPLIDEKIRAGFPSPASGGVGHRLDLNEHLVRNPAATFFLIVSGDSMVGEGINDGDMVVVDRSVEPRSGSIVVAAIEGDFTLKRFVKAAASFELHSGNPDYPVIHPRREDDCVVGVVRWILRKCSR
ncbi:MAG: translesion error-prone DNA polymerase V autoproteolytic subunit [Candidatus Accumulibacter sp.]|nr:translesion error-prone DNA polymerase V autoproteolytic subunit [Accumulibacter sp.]